MKKYKSEALMVCHQDAEGLHRLGIISDEEMLEFDETCLVEDAEAGNAVEEPLEMARVTA